MNSSEGTSILTGRVPRGARTSAVPTVPPPLISIGGASRSGSTLLTLMLGGLEGYVGVGELHYIWSRGCLQNMLCGCGVPFRECPFWGAVLERVYGGRTLAPARELDALQSSVAHIRRLPALVSPVRFPGFDARLRRYAQHVEALCAAIREVSGATCIVDASKLPSACYVLGMASGPGSRFVHLVRDSRAVAFSLQRKKRKPDIHWRHAYMRRFSPMRSAMHWNGSNVAMELVGASSTDVSTVRYEDLVADPSATIRRLAASVPDGLFQDGEVQLETIHTVSGNPLRFTSGALTIKSDSEWRERMTLRDRRVVKAATAPLLYRYGYLRPAD